MLTVLAGGGGDPVSFYTTVGGWVALLNQVWGLEGCPLKGQTMRKNRSVRFGFCGSTVLLGCRGD